MPCCMQVSTGSSLLCLNGNLATGLQLCLAIADLRRPSNQLGAFVAKKKIQRKFCHAQVYHPVGGVSMLQVYRDWASIGVV